MKTILSIISITLATCMTEPKDTVYHFDCRSSPDSSYSGDTLVSTYGCRDVAAKASIYLNDGSTIHCQEYRQWPFPGYDYRDSALCVTTGGLEIRFAGIIDAYIDTVGNGILQETRETWQAKGVVGEITLFFPSIAGANLGVVIR